MRRSRTTTMYAVLGVACALLWLVAWRTRWRARDGTFVHVRPWLIHVDTEILNAWPAIGARRWMHGKAHRAALAFYDVGIVVAGVAMLCAITVIIGTCVQVFERALAARSALVKRSDAESSAPPLWLTVLIPGISIPWGDVVPLFLVGLACQVAHEAGHAFAAALHWIEPMSMGLLVAFPAFPIAYVALPDYASHSVRARWQILSAGVWHNAVVFIAITVVSLVVSLAWRDSQSLHVFRASDVVQEIPRGSHITALNDLDFGRMKKAERLDVWTQFVHDRPLPAEPGWCIPLHAWQNATNACCFEKSDTSVCFVGQGRQGCFEPMSVLNAPLERCEGACTGGVCAAPDPRWPLARLLLDNGTPTLIVLRSPFRALTSMRVSPHTLRAPFSWLVRDTFADTWYARGAYVYKLAVVVNIALILINMLPIPALDGSAYLREGLTMALLGPTSPDAEHPGDAITHAAQHRIKRFQRVVETSVCVLTGCAVIGSLIVTIVHK